MQNLLRNDFGANNSKTNIGKNTEKAQIFMPTFKKLKPEEKEIKPEPAEVKPLKQPILIDYSDEEE